MGGEASNIGGKPWGKVGQNMGKSRKSRKIMGKIWETHENTLKIHGKISENIGNVETPV